MKKNLLLLALLMVSISAFSQGIVVTPHATNNPAATNQLVNDVLLDNSCLAQVSNVTKSTGTDFGYSQGNGIGTFSNTNDAFPFTSGVVLTSGNALAAQGPNTNTSSFSSPAWGGDADINAAITMSSKNATVLEFDFIPATPAFSIDYIFASEEYGAYQCESNDGFVMLLTNVTAGGAAQNVALIPVTGDPISIDSIKDEINNSACPSVNPDYFGAFYGGGDAATAPINYEGRTILMNASATLIPGNTYHLKIVIADDGGDDNTDGEYDSAVFFPEGGFNLGQQLLGPDLTIANGTALCGGDTFTLDTGLGPNAGLYTFEWTRNGDPIPGGAVITDDLAGTYAVSVTINGTPCVNVQDIVIEHGVSIVANDPNDLPLCDNGGGDYTYNLAQNTTVVKAGLDPETIVSYHATEDNANTGDSPLNTTHVVTGNETIWVRVKSHNSTCYDVKSFELQIVPIPAVTKPTNLVACEEVEGEGQAVFDLTVQNGVILGSQPVNENEILYFTSLVGAEDGSVPIENPDSYVGTSETIYVRVQRNFDSGCYTTTDFDLVVMSLPTLVEPADVTACNTYELPVLPEGDYYTSPNGEGIMLNAGDEITTSQTLYIYATNESGDVVCPNEVSFYVDIITAASAPTDVSACGGYTLPVLPAGQFYYTGPNGTGAEITAGTVIGTTQTIYFYIPTAASCTEDTNFTVTITDAPAIADPADVDECTPYTLPALPANQNYYTGPDGTGTQIAAGTVISASQTLYVYSVSPTEPDCTSEQSFEIIINNIQVNDLPDVTICGKYVLPALPAGQNYYTGPGGTGTMLAVSTQITTSQTIYIYSVSPTNPACNDEENFEVVVNPNPTLLSIPDVTACDSYILPDTLPSYADYYTASNGGGTLLPAGTEISTSQTIYVYAVSPNGCTKQRTFSITIIDIGALAPSDQEECGSYVLPSLPIGNYYTEPNGGGTQLTPGANITSSQTVYVYVVSNTTPECTAEDSFEVVINPNPTLLFIPDVIVCGSYTLPDTLPAGANYYTASNGGGTLLPVGTVINTSQTVYAYVISPEGCTKGRSFSVTVINDSIAPADVDACGSYELPALAIGGYYTAPSGGGTQITVGDLVTSTQTVYVYVEVTSGPNCTNNDSFSVTISPPAEADAPEDVTSCVNYVLPALTNGDYYTGPLGTGTMLNAGDVIAIDTTLYVYYVNTAIPGCFADNPFDIVINDIDIDDPADQLVCDRYFLPTLPIGDYYTGPGATGTMLNAGDSIESDQTIYVYATTNTLPVCTDEESFTVTIKPDPAIDTPENVGSCGTYILPALTVGNYYTESGGLGTVLNAGDVIDVNMDIYIYAETGGVPNCTAEHMFSVFINPQAPVDAEACDSYVLPVLPVGSYYTGPAGSGFQLFAGDVIVATQDIYVYIEMTEIPNCTDNNFFTVTINQSPVLDTIPVLQPVCDAYELPELIVGNYYTEPNGEGTLLPAGSFITSTQTVYIYAETGTIPNCVTEGSFEVTINNTPIPDARSTVERCDQYILDELIVGDYYGLSGGPDVAGQVQYVAGDVITESTTLYIYAESGTVPNCFAENNFEVEIYSITADNPEDGAISVCDSYTLPELTIGDYYLLSGGTSTPGQVLYEAGDVITTSQTLYVYAELGGRVNCNDENELEITVFDTPQVDDIQGDVEVCFEFVLPPLTVGTYYTGSMGTGTVLNAGDLITSTQMVYIYEEVGNAEVTCFTEHSYLVTVYTIEVPEIEDFSACENYVLPELAIGDYYTGPGGTGTLLPAGTLITTTSVIYIYAETTTIPVCTAESDFEVIIVYPPTFVQPEPLATCGVDDLGHGLFSLTASVQFAIAGQLNVSATVHETLIDAEANNDPIGDISAYANIEADEQTVYIRLQSDLASTCYTIVELDLIVNPRPQAATPDDYELCDNGLDDTDEISVFDLSTINAIVLDGMDPIEFAVTYYESMPAAQLGLTPIATPGSYNSGTRTIYVRVTNNTTGCYDIVLLELIVHPLPVVNNPLPYTLCDENNPGDEVEIFDLTTQYSLIAVDPNGV
ncbi:choice-of-anchor L domain-containing protein, partial [uncultured Flavobacterium sp.]|uniref:choice-of-anchor L domain-containing protein n=1 Tax=uncultured Flavobacterium sp. TaxID=165435 RepID=UPI0025D452BB